MCILAVSRHCQLSWSVFRLKAVVEKIFELVGDDSFDFTVCIIANLKWREGIRDIILQDPPSSRSVPPATCHIPIYCLLPPTSYIYVNLPSRSLARDHTTTLKAPITSTSKGVLLLGVHSANLQHLFVCHPAAVLKFDPCICSDHRQHHAA